MSINHIYTKHLIKKDTFRDEAYTFLVNKELFKITKQVGA
jgi:hypothetical protein